jgi:hypothetical protein
VSDWELDRLPGDVRQEAENAAQHDGLPLHRWLGKLIRETCADEGIALARELSPNLMRQPAESGQREIPMPPRSATEPIRVQPAARFTERAAAASPPRQPANANESLVAAMARPSEPDEPLFAAEMARPVEPPSRASEPPRTAPRRFGNVPRMPEPRVAEALHVVEPRPTAPPVEPRPAVPQRPAVRVAPTAREAIGRDIAAVRSAAMARSADGAASPAPIPARATAFAPSPVSPQSTATPPAAQSPESSFSTTGESWSARRARSTAGGGRNTAPRRSAADAAVPSRSSREPMPAAAVSARAASPNFATPRDDRSAVLAKLVEGLRRNELSAVGEARLFLKLMTEHMASIGDITAATGRTPEQVSRSLRLLGLSDRLRDLIDRGALSREQAFALLDAEHPSPNSTPPSSGHRMP